MIELIKTVLVGAAYFMAACITFAFVMYVLLVIYNFIKIYYDVWKARRTQKRANR